MPLYDCVLLFKNTVRREVMLDLVTRVGRHVYTRNGVITDITSFGTVQLGYGVKKLDGRHYQGLLMQMTMMATPSINKELHYLNKEDRLLRWLLVKHRDTKYGLEALNEDDGDSELSKLRSTFYDDEDTDEDDEDEDDEDEYDLDQEDKNNSTDL